MSSNKLSENAKFENRKKDKKTAKVFEDAYGEKLSPNDILAVEYLRAIKKQNCKINAICIKRDMSLPTASSIREQMINKDVYLESFLGIFKKILLDAKEGKKDLTEIYGINEDFKNQILKLGFDKIAYKTLDDICHILATKEKTLADVKRKIFHIILDIKEKDLRKIYFFQIKNELKFIDLNV